MFTASKAEFGQLPWGNRQQLFCTITARLAPSVRWSGQQCGPDSHKTRPQPLRPLFATIALLKMKITPLILPTLFCFATSCALGALNDPELLSLSSMPATILQTCGSFPDAQGRQGANKTSAFEADEQRGAMQSMTAAIALQNDAYVASDWLAVPYAYSQQNPDGSFAGLSTSAFHMRFWMAWSCHALVLLLNDPHYGPMYSAQVQALLPNIALSMDFLLANGACSLDKKKTQLWQDVPSPNRSIIIADAFFLGAELLQNYSTPAKIAAYRAMGQSWLDNEFNNYSGTNLFRAVDGAFLEPGGNYSGLDTSYQGLNTLFLDYWIFSNGRTGQGNLATASDIGARAGNLFAKRFQMGAVDDTDNTRSGPNNLDGAAKTLDKSSARLALMFYSAMYNHPEVLPLAQSLGPEINGLPPNLITYSTMVGINQIPLTVPVYFTNAGVDSLDPAFQVQITGLPPGLTASAPTFLGVSSALVLISGTPTAAGSFTAMVAASNMFGANSGLTLQFNIAAQN